MIWKCQRLPVGLVGRGDPWHTHRVEAPDELTARALMFDRSFSHAWLDPEKTLVWSTEGTGRWVLPKPNLPLPRGISDPIFDDRKNRK